MRRLLILCTLFSMLISRPVLASPAAVPTAGVALSSVSQPSVTLSSTAAGANAVTYTINFTTSAAGAIPAGGTITLIAPSGTLWPSSQQVSSYVLTDATTPAGSFTAASSVHFAAPGLPIFNFLNASGAAVSITIPNAINAGDSLTLSVAGVVNPGPGSKTLAVATSTDQIPVNSSGYTITTPGSVSPPTLTLSSTAAAAKPVTYTINFTTSAAGAIPAGGTITLIAPSGTLWPSSQQLSSYVLTDATTPTGSFTAASNLSFAASGLPVFNFLNASGAIVSLTVPNAINAGDALSLTISGVANPGPGIQSIAVSTTADPAPVNSAAYTITPQSSVSQPSVSVSSTVGGAASVTYTIGFSISASGMIPSGGTITIAGPPGTVWPTNGGAYALTDSTTSAGSSPFVNSVQSVANGSTVTLVLPNAIKAGDALSLAISGVTNPGAGTDTLSVSTSSDSSPTVSAPYILTGTSTSLTSVSGPNLSLSSNAGGADGVSYAVGFTTSVGSGGVLGGSGTLTLVAPAGTIFGGCPYGCGGGNASYTITDLTNAARSGTAVPISIAAGGSTVSVEPTNTIQAGDQIVLTITQVTNPPADAGTIAVSTSSDTAPVSISDPISAPQPVSSPSLSLSSTASGANGVTYAVSLTTTAGAGQILGGLGAITLAAPAGTIFGACPYGCGGGNASYTITDITHPSGSGGAAPVGIARRGSVVSIEPGNTIQAGDQIVVTITQVTNPPAANGTIAVSTSSDTVPVNVWDPITVANSVDSPELTLSSTAVGFSGVTYTVNFTASTTGALEGGLSAITLSAPAGTNFSATGPITVTDATTPSGSGTVGGAGVIDGGAITSFVVPQSIKAGDAVTVAVGGVTNSSTAGALSLTISTSSDVGPTTLGYMLIQGTTVTGIIDASDGSVAVGAHVQACLATNSCTGAVTDGSGAFILDAPAGTYTFTAFAPTGSRDSAAAGRFTVGSIGLSGVTLKLGPPPGIHPGFTIISPNFGTEDTSTANPNVYWGQPFALQIDPSVFPITRTVVAMQVVINGIDSNTGLPANKVVNIGGTVNGNPTGIVVGTNPITVTIPPLAPIHGNITFSVSYSLYPLGSTPPGVAAPEILDLVYPNAPPQTQPTDPVPGYFTNTGESGGISLGAASIVGPDAAYFSVPPLSSMGVPPGPDCGTGTVRLQQYIGVGEPGAVNTCGAGVLFSPPANGTKIFYYATLEVSVGPDIQIPVSLIGCDEQIAMFAAEVTGFDPCSSGGPDADKGGDDTGGTNGNGNGNGGSTWVDPSGMVLVTDGSTAAAPLSGGTVTLEQGPTLSGPFSAVPNGSAIMSPANRVNPDTSDSQGQFGWDVMAGSYQVTATSPGCSTAVTLGLAIPPPVTDLSLTVTCPTMPVRSATQSTVTTSAPDSPYTRPVTFSDAVTGSSPKGTVTFSDGSTVIGAGVLSNGSASLTINSLAPGPHTITTVYSGDAANQPSSSPALTEAITVAPAITTQPANQLVTAGQTAIFTAAASGIPTPSVQWQVSTDGGGTFGNLAGASSPTLSFTTSAAQNGYQYRAVFTNTAGTATTSLVTLTVGNPPPVIIPPVSLPSGSTATPIPPTATNTPIAAGTAIAGVPTASVPMVTTVPTTGAGRPAASSVGSTTWYFVGGRTDGGYSDTLALLNTASRLVRGTTTVYSATGKSTIRGFTVQAHSRNTLDLKSLTGVSGHIAIRVQADLPIVVSNTTQHDDAALAASAGVTAPAGTWYLAEDYNGAGFTEELDLLNPGSTAAHVHLVWPRSVGTPAVAHDLIIAPTSSQVISVNTFVKSGIHGTIVTADQPIVAGRTLLFGLHVNGADTTTGTTQASTILYFAEGATTNRFQEYLAILNPSRLQQAGVTARFFGASGLLLGTKTVTIDPNHLATIKVNDTVTTSAVSTVLQSNIPVVAERSMYFSAPTRVNSGGTVGLGQPNSAQGWAFSQGDTQPGQSEFELLFNPNQAAAVVEADYYLGNGRIVRTRFTLAGRSRITIDVARMVPQVGKGYHGVVLRSTNGVSFVAEQAVYADNMSNGSATPGTPVQ